MLTAWFCTLVNSLHATTSVNNSGDASVGTLALINQPGCVPRLIFPYAVEITAQFQPRKSFEIVRLQLWALLDATTSATNCRFSALSRAMIAGVANRGFQSAV